MTYLVLDLTGGDEDSSGAWRELPGTNRIGHSWYAGWVLEQISYTVLMGIIVCRFLNNALNGQDNRRKQVW